MPAWVMCRFCLLLLLVLGALVRPATAIAETIQIEIGPGFNYLDSDQQPFGFLPGGTFRIEIFDFFLVSPRTPLYALYCHPGETAVLGDNHHPPCGAVLINSTEEYCKFGKVITTNDPVVISGTMNEENFYSLWFYSCSQKGPATVNFMATNLDGNHLSSTQIRFPEVLLAFFCLWNILLLAWCWNWFKFRTHNILLHNLLTVVFLVKLISLVVEFLHWYFQSRDGNPLIALQILDILFNILFVMSLLYTCSLIAKGWCIVRILLELHEHRLSLLISLITACGVLFFLIFQSYLLVVVIVLYILYVRFVYLNVNGVVYSLELRAMALAGLPYDAIQTAGLFRKIDMLRLFQRVLTVYIFVVLLTVIGIRFFISGKGWIEGILLQIFDLFFGAYLAYVFRLQDFTIYSTIAERIRQEQSRQPIFAKSNHFLAVQLPGVSGGTRGLMLAVMEDGPPKENTSSESTESEEE